MSITYTRKNEVENHFQLTLKKPQGVDFKLI